jgi:hypothetical protein
MDEARYDDGNENQQSSNGQPDITGLTHRPAVGNR